MCGIFGSLGPPIELSQHESWIKQSMRFLNSRGPDSGGVLNFENVTMGSRRLRVHDTRALADQPMTSVCGRYSLVFNGAIYNFRELREELIENGISFSTTSDTEVLLQAFILWGKSSFSRLRGMFAFAILDRQNRQLYVCRDHLGIKPLYYSLSKNQIVFSSLIKPILAFPGSATNVDREKIPEQFAFQNLVPPATIFQNVFVLQPGSYIEIDFSSDFRASTFYFWRMDDKLLHSCIDQELEEILIQSLRDCWNNDRETAIQLSGGVDSSLLVALTATQNIRESIPTHSVIFDADKSRGFKWQSEEQYVRFVGKKYNCEQDFSVFSDKQIKEALCAAIYAFEQPLYSANSVLYYLHAKEIAKKSTVVISGEGADDIFLGYFDGNAIDTNLESMAPQYIKDDVLIRLFGKDGHELAKRSRRDLLASDRLRNFTPTQKASALTIETVLHGLLARQDRMLMSHAVEGRPPYCSIDLIKLRFSTPDGMIHAACTGKRNIRNAAANYYPEKFVYRKKQWLAGPTQVWCSSKMIWKPFIDAIDLDVLSQYMEVDRIRRLINSFDELKPWQDSDLALVFATLNFSLWHQIFIEKKIDINNSSCL